MYISLTHFNYADVPLITHIFSCAAGLCNLSNHLAVCLHVFAMGCHLLYVKQMCNPPHPTNRLFSRQMDCVRVSLQIIHSTLGLTRLRLQSSGPTPW